MLGQGIPVYLVDLQLLAAHESHEYRDLHEHESVTSGTREHKVLHLTYYCGI